MMLGGVQDFDAIICISNSVLEVLQKAFRTVKHNFRALTGMERRIPIHLETVPLGTESALFDEKDQASARARLGLPEHSHLILIFGRYSHIDKMDLLPVLELARRLKERRGSAAPKIIFAGSDFWREPNRRRCIRKCWP